MRIDTSKHDDYAILTLKGEFDTFYCPIFQKEVEGLIDSGISHVVVNMRLVKFINSTALGAVIKLFKRCRAEGGELVLARPSPFVKEIVQKLGIDQLVPMFDDEEAATKHIVRQLNARELSDAVVDEEKILITFPDDTRNRMIGGKKALVGRMSNVDGERLQFLWSGERAGLTADQSRQLFFAGSEISMKFQVKLFKKGFFELRGRVTGVEASDDQTKVTVAYLDITDGDRAALNQFAADMAFLKQQLPGA